MHNDWQSLGNYTQCVSVQLVLSVTVVTNDIKISLRDGGVASATTH